MTTHRKHPVVGIDLGTTYSAVAAYNQYSLQTEILYDGASQTVPSVVSVYGGRVVVGETARRNLAFDPANTVIEIKREMGEMFRPDTLASTAATGTGTGRPTRRPASTATRCGSSSPASGSSRRRSARSS